MGLGSKFGNPCQGISDLISSDNYVIRDFMPPGRDGVRPGQSGWTYNSRSEEIRLLEYSGLLKNNDTGLSFHEAF